MCEQLAQGRYLAVPQAGIEPGTSGSPVRHATITPPSHKPSHHGPYDHVNMPHSKQVTRWHHTVLLHSTDTAAGRIDQPQVICCNNLMRQVIGV